MLYLSRPLLAWMAKRWPIHEGEAEVLGELDRFLATGQLPTDARRLDVGAAEYAHGILQRLALEEAGPGAPGGAGGEGPGGHGQEGAGGRGGAGQSLCGARPASSPASRQPAGEEKKIILTAVGNPQITGVLLTLCYLYCTNWGLD